MERRNQRQTKGRRDTREEAPEQDGSSGRFFKVAFAILAAFLLIMVVLLIVFLISGEDKTEYSVALFTSGTDNLLLGGKSESSKGYVSVPKDATIKSFRFNVTGTFPIPVERYDVGVNPTSIVADDLDQDGDQDIVVLNSGEDDFTILKNTKEGKFVMHANYPAPSNSSQVITANLNGDRYPDIVVIGVSRMVDVFLAYNDPEFNFSYDGPSRYLISDYSYSICALDLDNDGDLDLAATCKNSRTLDLLKNRGDGTFVSDVILPIENSPGEIVSGDLNGDQYPDLVIINRGDGDYKLGGKAWHYTTSVIMNDKGTLSNRTDYGVGKTPSAVSLSDLNNDGALDIVVANEGDAVNGVSVLMNDGKGIFPAGDGTEIGAQQYKAMDPNDVFCSDVNGDGYVDILTACRNTDSINVLLSKDKGTTFAPYKNCFVGYSPKSIFIADYDLDGDNDVASSDMRALDRQSSIGSVSILRNYGYGIFSTDREYKVGNCPRGVATEDLNGDGKPDISTANYFGSTLTALINNGQGDFGSREDYQLGLEPYSVVAADFDGDGHVDAASADEARFMIIMLFNDGTGHFKNGRPAYNIGGYPFSLHTDDYDGDGDFDLLTANHGQRSVAILNNTGDGTFETYWRIDLGYRMPFDAAFLDVNKDGIRDIVTANLGTDSNYTNTVSVLMGIGSVSFKTPVDYTVGLGPTALMTADIDQDGDIDIGTTNLADGTVSILKNNGDGTFGPASTYTVGKRPYFLKALEIDGDGYPDLVVSNADSNSLTLLLNDGSGGFSMLYEKTTGAYPYYMAVDDLDSDGRTDIVVTNVNTGSVSVVSDYYYPSDVRIDLDGNPNPPEYSLPTGELRTSVRTPDLSSDVQKYLDKHQHMADEEGNVQVPITILTGKSGLVKISDIELIYTR